MAAFQSSLSFSLYISIRVSVAASKKQVSYDYRDITNQTKLIESISGGFYSISTHEYDSWKTTWDNSKGQLLEMWNFFSDNVKEAFAGYIALKYG